MNDEQAVRDVIAEWMRASTAGENDRVLELMTEDVVFLTAGRPPMRGRDAFRAAQQGMPAGMKVEGQSDVQEVQVAGDLAYVWTELRVTTTPAGGEPVRRHGYTLTVFRRQPDGRWLLARDANMLALDE